VNDTSEQLQLLEVDVAVKNEEKEPLLVKQTAASNNILEL
jgi:hypothetical protein